MNPVTSTPLRKALLWFVIAAALVPSTLLLKGVSTDIYKRAIAAEIDVPNRLTEITMLALIGVFVLTAWGLRKIDRKRLITAFAVGVGIIAAYVSSEIVKLILEQPRPCRAVAEAAHITACPAIGDWSFPSNHSVIAFAVATGILVIAASHWALLAYIGAALVAVLRVIDGVHYPHDVLAGAILGVCVTIAVYLLLYPVQRAFFLRINARTKY